MSRQNGFTIVELMIATSIFAVILLVISFGALSVGKNYYKGITSSRAQEASRSIMDSITKPMELSGAVFEPNTAGGFKAYCIGTVRFTFSVNKQVSDSPSGANQQRHALWQDRPNTTSPCSPVDLTETNPSTQSAAAVQGTQGKELVPKGMRLTEFEVNSVSDRYYNVRVGIIAGDDEIIDMSNPDPAEFKCQDSTKGGQFCASAPLATTVYRRVAK